MSEKEYTKFFAKDKEVGIMPTIELLECERIAYINEMEEYLQKLKNMEYNQAKKVSFENLKKSKIIDENGEFTEHYECMQMNIPKKKGR